MAKTSEYDSSLADEPIGAPPPHPREALGPTARKILDAAQRLLADGGFSAVTLEKIAAEAGVNKAAIRYCIGNKAGLIEALVDALMAEEFQGVVHDLPGMEPSERIHAAIRAKRRMVLRADEFRGFFDILPHAIRGPELRQCSAGLYPWWFEQNLRLLGLDGQGPDGRPELLVGLGRLLSAVVDGLSVQEALDPDGFDPDVPLTTLEYLLERSRVELESLAGSGRPTAEPETDFSDP